MGSKGIFPGTGERREPAVPEEKNCLQAIARLAIDMGAADVGFSALERETDGMTGSISIVVPLSDA